MITSIDQNVINTSISKVTKSTSVSLLMNTDIRHY